MSIHADEAIVLSATPYSNTSLIATFFARKEGKIRVVARGARSPKSKIGVGLEPATRVQAEWSMPTGKDLGTLRYCETISVFHNLWSDMEAMRLTGQILKTMDRVFGAHEGQEEHYEWLAVALEALDSGAEAGSIGALFMAGLLKRLGIAPVLSYCGSCTKKPGEEKAAFDVESGELRCSRCELPTGQAVRLRVGSVMALGEAVGIAPEKIRSLRFHASIQGEIIQLVRALISFHLGVSLPVQGPRTN